MFCCGLCTSLSFFCVLLLAGWAVISYFYIARPIRDMELLMESTAALAHPGDTPIRLPESMKNAENRLNLVREQALRNIQAARDAEQRKNDLVVYLAHDLKTPLTSVIGYLTLLQDEPELSPAMRARYTGVALEKALRLEDLVNEFFDITRFSLTHLELELQSVDLKRMLEQIVSEFEPTLRQKEMRCTLDLPQTLTVVCDPDKMARVFDNLLNNAAHYAYPASTVQIRAQQREGAVVLTFQNAGRTIPAEKLKAHLFKIGHHGQKDGVSETLLRMVDPEAAVCCASSDRRYDSAHPDVIRMLSQAGIHPYFSDCPKAEGIDLPPHQALEFELEEGRAVTGRYLRAVE